MKNRIKISLLLFMLATFCHSCSAIRKSRNKSSISYAAKNAELIKECAAFAISATLDSPTKSFYVRDIQDTKTRKKVGLLGNEVSVVYKSGGYYEIQDSIVTFKTLTLLMGVTEIVYDFAYTPRSFASKGSRTGEYYFAKVADRIYYRKRPFPMM